MTAPDPSTAATAPPARVGLVVHGARPSAVAMAQHMVGRLTNEGVDVVIADEGHDPAQFGLPVRDTGFVEDLDLVLSLGGDGTFLRAAHHCRDAGVPLLGVNLGNLGFLAEVDPEQVDDALDAVVGGDWTIAERATLEVVATDADGARVGSAWSLNEVAIEKSARQHMLHTAVSVGDHRYTRFGSDAVIVATSTGSTAYALSAGGPIVSPLVDVTLVVPVAPHTLYDRTLVADPSETIMVTVIDDQEPAIVSCDGRTPMIVPSGGTVSCQGSATPVLVAQVDPLPFPTLLRRKFNLV